MFTFEPTTDLDQIRDLLANRRCYRRIVNDSAPAPEDLKIEANERIRYVLVGCVGNPVGFFLLLDDYGVGIKSEVHFTLLPEVWGSTQAIVLAFLRWIWTNTDLQKLRAPVPSYNRLALKLARRCGFREYGIAPATATRRGKPFHLILLEIARP